MTTTTTDYNSTKNQDIKSQLVGKYVNVNLNLIIQHLINSEDKGDWEDELLSIGSQPDYETAAEDNGWVYNEDEDIYTNEESDNEYSNAEEVCKNEGIDYDFNEPYEFWAVDKWFANKLKEDGEIVENIFGITVWGRCTTGQAILLDHCISRIAEGMEILEGQSNDWSKQD